MTFPDLFSKQAATYAKARPRYPNGLFEWLSSQCAGHDLAWDCATGSGQAAVSLAEHFDRVIATDASEAQISNATTHPRITYRVALAHDSGLEPASVDLVTVATALHWLETEKFYAEAGRVLRPGGVLAVWSYAGTHSTPEIQRIHDGFAFDMLRAYWSEGAKRNWIGRYKDVALPFTPIEAPQFYVREQWSLDQLIDYMNSWSAVQTYKERHSANPVERILHDLRQAWGTAVTRELTWELWLKVSQKPGG